MGDFAKLLILLTILGLSPEAWAFDFDFCVNNGSSVEYCTAFKICRQSHSDSYCDGLSESKLMEFLPPTENPVVNTVTNGSLSATFMVNGSGGNYNAKVGDRLKFEWDSENGNSASLGYSSDSECELGDARSKVGNSLSGSRTITIPKCAQGATYSLAYTVKKKNSGKTATASVHIIIENPNAAKVLNDIKNTSNRNDGSQTSSQNASLEISSLSSSYLANVGVIDCAKGALAAANSPDSDGKSPSSEACMNNFSAANSMKDNEDKMAQNLGKDSPQGFPEVPAVLGTQAAQATLEEFEKKFAIDKAEYVRQMLASRGSAPVLTQMLKSTIPEEKIATMLTAPATEKIADNDKYLTADPNAAVAGKKMNGALKESLKRKLTVEYDPVNRSLASTSPSTKDRKSTLTPEVLLNHLDGESPESVLGVEGEKEPSTEVDLFGVVHRKYVELVNRMRR